MRVGNAMLLLIGMRITHQAVVSPDTPLRPYGASLSLLADRRPVQRK
jgi:hypothetical protein